jgi:hypothetical protein
MPTMEKTMSLPMASDTMRCEARMIMEAAVRAAGQMAMVEASVGEAQARIRATQYHIEALDREGVIDHKTATGILRLLMPVDP